MPDWSYHPLKQFILDNIRPKTGREWIHTSMSRIASFPGGHACIEFLGHMRPPQELQRDILQMNFCSPIGLSGLIDPHLSGLKAFHHVGFGFMEIGPITLRKHKKQNPPERENGRLLFSSDHEMVPLKRALRKLSAFDNRIPLIARIDPQADQLEREAILSHLTPYADAFILTSEQILTFSEDKKLPTARPIFVSLAADDKAIRSTIEKVWKQPGVGGILIDAPRKRADGYWQEEVNANHKLAIAVKKVKTYDPELITITSGGVETPEDALVLMTAGADLLMLTDGYVQAGPGLPKRIHERLLSGERKPFKTGWHWSLLFGLTILAGGLIAFYFALTSIILPYDELFIGLTKEELIGINPLILSFMAHDRMALAGTMNWFSLLNLCKTTIF
ncbi:MAG: hypothetical protein ACI4XL_03420 [Bacillus sp. (in: firmicutes)]